MEGREVMEPKPHQIEGELFLAASDNAILADEAGNGKTLQAILACRDIGAQYVHVICPASGVEMWKRAVIDKDIALSGAHGHGAAPRWFVESYESATKHGPYTRVIDVLILDEAHYLKGVNSKRTRAIYGAGCDRASGIASQAKRVFLLTGTPVPNNPSELWPHLRALFPQTIISPRTGRPMNYVEFTERYCDGYMGDYGPVITGGKNLAELREKIAPYVLRRKTEGLPPLRFHDLPLTVTQTELSAIGAVAPSIGELTIEDLMELSPHLATMRRLIGTLKVRPLIDWASCWMLANKTCKLVLFAFHRDVIYALAEAFPNSVRAHGGTPLISRQAAIDDFQTNPLCGPFIGQLTSAGTVITLTAAHAMVIVEADWVPGNNEQMVRRIWRIGQKEPCDVYFAAIEGSIDEKIARAYRRKAETIKELLE
jgi:SWI/SNF-related matrix-associated actin-dependent regulator of chromatin subfamily A-like protein 1